MERKKIFRSVWFWVVLVVLVALDFSSFFRGSGGFTEVSTSTALDQFAEGNVESATINDKEQTLDLELRNEVDGSDQITASYPLGASDDVFDLVSGERRRQRASTSTPTSPRTASWSACWSASCRS